MNKLINEIPNKYLLSEEEKEKFGLNKKQHQDILIKYEIRDKNMNVPSIQFTDKNGNIKWGINLLPRLLRFTFPADFKTTFEMIDKFFPDLIRKAESMDYVNLILIDEIEVNKNLRRWWFGFLQVKMEEELSFKSLN